MIGLFLFWAVLPCSLTKYLNALYYLHSSNINYTAQVEATLVTQKGVNVKVKTLDLTVTALTNRINLPT